MPSLRLYTPTEPRTQPRKRKRRKLPNFLRWPEALKLLAWCEEQVRVCAGRKARAARRDLFIVQVGLYLGLRVSEICGLDVKDIDLESRNVFVVGKGERDRYVRIGKALLPALNSWLAGRDGILIPTDRGGRMNQRTIHWRLARATNLAGLTVRVHPHVLRHTFASHMLETGATIREVQAMLGHANISNTAIYLDLDTSRLAAAVDRL